MIPSIRTIVVIVYFAITTHVASAQDKQTTSLVVGHRFAPDCLLYIHANQLIAELKKRTGVELILKRLPNYRSLDESNQGKIDGGISRVRSLSYNPRYPNLRIIDAHWLNARMTAIAPKGSKVKISGWPSLKQYKFCFQRGVLFIRSKMKEHYLSGYSLNKPITALKHVETGWCDVTAYWYERLGSSEQKYIDDHNLEVVYEFARVEGYLYLHKKWAQIIPKIQDALIAMQQDGTRETILLDKY